MKKKIVITSCKNCPYRSHAGAFGNPSYIPVCDKSNGKHLPYEVKMINSPNLLTAVATEVIPLWCPLENED